LRYAQREQAATVEDKKTNNTVQVAKLIYTGKSATCICKIKIFSYDD